MWYSYYDPNTMLFTGMRGTGGPEACPGLGCMEGDYDHLKWRPALDEGGDLVVVEYQPPAPPATDMYTWEWNATNWRWEQASTLLARQLAAKAERDARLAASVGRQLQAYRTNTLVTETDAYIAALVAVDSQPGFPDNINWPVPPWI